MARQEEFNREDIVSKAVQVFWEKGYSGTSIQDLVDATGLNRSSIYNSFGSKQNLYRVSLEQYEDESNKVFQKALLKSSSPLEAIRRILSSALAVPNEDERSRGCFILNCKMELGSSDEELRQWLLKNQDKSITLFKDLVTEGQAEGQISSVNSPETVAYSLFNTFQGLRLTGILTKDPQILKDIIENTIKNIQ